METKDDSPSSQYMDVVPNSPSPTFFYMVSPKQTFELNYILYSMPDFT